MRFTSLLLIAALAAAPVVLPGCTSDKAYKSGQVLTAADTDMLWDRARLVLQGQGYQINEQASSRSALEMETHWLTQLVPARYKGKRRKVHVRFVEEPGNAIRTEVLVEQQRNTEISDPLNIVAADWEDERDEFVQQREDIILYKIESFFVAPAGAE